MVTYLNMILHVLNITFLLFILWLFNTTQNKIVLLIAFPFLIVGAYDSLKNYLKSLKKVEEKES